MLDYILDHILNYGLNHILNHMLDHMIIGSIIPALQILKSTSLSYKRINSHSIDQFIFLS